MFNEEQRSYTNLRSILSERTNRVVAWVGAGLSAPAGLPTWEALKTELCSALSDKALTVDSASGAALAGAAKNIAAQTDLWLSFQLLHEKLGRASFSAAIRASLGLAETCPIPAIYTLLYSLPVSGVLTLNLDRLATRAFSQHSPGHGLNEFNGQNAGQFVHVLKSGTSFIVNLHGIAADDSSWVFTRDQLAQLLATEGYRTFIDACLCTRTVIFVGLSPDDMAVGGHLERLRRARVDLGQHFWLTDHSDSSTEAWAEATGLQRIVYANSDGMHKELGDLLALLSARRPAEEAAPPPVLLEDASTVASWRSSEQLRSEMSAERLRNELNAHAAAVLSNSPKEDYARYDSFCEEYDDAIYRAWYVSTKPPQNVLFGYVLEKEIAEGAFGRVFAGRSPTGDPVAVKILKEDVRRKTEMLQSFRRGVRSMRILADRQVAGMIPYHQASEIPAACVMDLVNGPNLHDAVRNRYCDSWEARLEIAVQLARIIRRAHLLPERVLHRDIRPPNIMLRDYYTNPDVLDVVVLDFDLSWHLGADELSIVNTAGLGGYLAPEQVTSRPGVSTRSATVDSFGFGMTLYYLCTATEPMYLQHRHGQWEIELFKTLHERSCSSWTCVPTRIARLIYNATLHEQGARWSMSQIEGELELLRDAVLSPEAIRSAELIAEELAARTLASGDYRRYSWNLDRLTAAIELASGVILSIVAAEVERTVQVRIEWRKDVGIEHKNVRKYLGSHMDQAVSRMREGGWRVLPETAMSSQAARIGFEIASIQLRDRMDASSHTLAECLRLFEF